MLEVHFTHVPLFKQSMINWIEVTIGSRRKIEKLVMPAWVPPIDDATTGKRKRTTTQAVDASEF